MNENEMKTILDAISGASPNGVLKEHGDMLKAQGEVIGEIKNHLATVVSADPVQCALHEKDIGESARRLDKVEQEQGKRGLLVLVVSTLGAAIGAGIAFASKFFSSN